MPSFQTAFGKSSRYVNAGDLAGREVPVTIDGVRLESVRGDHGPEQKLVVYFVGASKGLILNRINATSVAAIAGTDDYEQWRGVPLVLYVDPNVQMQGQRVSGVRVRAVRSPAAVVERPAFEPRAASGGLSGPAFEETDRPLRARDIPF